MVSADNSVVFLPNQSITDSNGNKWSIANGQVDVNGVADPTTGNVVELAYESGLVWQKNTDNLWWSKSTPLDAWSPTYGTSVSPVRVSPNNLVISLPGQSINDANGNIWSVVNGQVVVNGAVDPTTGNVIQMAYENGLVWQKNADNLWWSKASPADGWNPPYGTSVDPVLGQSASPNNAVLVADPNASPSSYGMPSIYDASGNAWSLTHGQVTLNGIVDPTTANVSELAYVDGKIWQENTSNLWWSKSLPSDQWGPEYGAPASPVHGGSYVFAPNGFYSIGAVAVPNDGNQRVGETFTLYPGAVVTTPGIQVSGNAFNVGDLFGGGQLILQGNSSLSANGQLIVEVFGTGSEPLGPLENNGTLLVSSSTLDVGNLSGTGVVRATAEAGGPGSTLAIQTATAGNTIQLESAHLYIGGAANQTNPGLSFLAPVTEFGQNSSITLYNTQATSEVFATSGPIAGELFLYNGSNLVADLHIGGQAQIYAQNNPPGAGSSVVLTAYDTGHSIPITSS